MKDLFRWEKFALLAVVLTWGWWAVQSEHVQRWLGDRDPVVGYFIIDAMAGANIDGQVGVRLSGTAEKLRSCTWKSVHWYLGSPSGVPIVARFTDPPRNNAPGFLHWQGLLVGIDMSRIPETYGEVVHKCGLLTVRSAFYVRGLARQAI